MTDLEDAYDEEDMVQEALREDVRCFPHQLEETFPEGLKRAVAEAAHTFSELGLFTDFDGDIKDSALMIQIWAIVETIRLDKGFPANLKL